MSAWEWDEAEYQSYLAHERHMFAWTLSHVGGIAASEAEARALRLYPYEPPGTRHRGIIFHDEAWHHAMVALHGNMYWQGNPALASASQEYRDESERCKEQQQPGGGPAR